MPGSRKGNKGDRERKRKNRVRSPGGKEKAGRTDRLSLRCQSGLCPFTLMPALAALVAMPVLVAALGMLALGLLIKDRLLLRRELAIEGFQRIQSLAHMGLHFFHV